MGKPDSANHTARASLFAGEQPNILLLVAEDAGVEFGSYGDKFARTPNLDELARTGVQFNRAFVPYSVCSPSRSSILTGLYPHQNGQIGLATHRYAMYENFPNIPSLLKKAGYRTGIIGKLHVNPESAFDFDMSWHNDRYTGYDHRDVQAVAQRAAEFISASDTPFFLMVNYPDTHFPLLAQQHGIPAIPHKASEVEVMPYVGVDSERMRGYTADYYSSVSRLDAGVGMLLEQLRQTGRANNTLVIFISDHGVQFSRGKTTNYESALRVPMLVRWSSRLPKGTSTDALVSSIDILPTILDAAELDAISTLPGHSLFDLFRTETEAEDVEWRNYIFGESSGGAPVIYYPQRSVRGNRFKLIVNLLQDRSNILEERYRNQGGRFWEAGSTSEEIAAASSEVRQAYQTWAESPPLELYDLDSDPYEFVNLAADPAHGQVRDRLLSALHKWQKDTQDPFRDPEKLLRYTAEVDDVHRRYPDQGYRFNPVFRWQYADYLQGE